MPDVKIYSEGKPNHDSLLNVLKMISQKAGKSGRISAVYIEVKEKYQSMLEYAKHKMSLNSDPNRERYNITSYSCLHFMKGVMEAADIETPWLIDPRPTSYIKEIQDDYPDLEYSFSGNKLVIEK